MSAPRLDLSIQVPLAGFTLDVALRSDARAIAVLGRSGAGKTSLLEAIAGLRPEARGRIALGGHVLLDSAVRVRLPPEARGVGYVPQDALLFPHLTVERNLRFGLAPGPDAEGRLEDAVALLELAPLRARWPRTLSGGERQRVAIGRALCTAPKLLLLDEPLAALDAALRDRILPFLLRVRDEAKVPLLYVTHQLGEARALATEAVVLERGRVEAHGPAAELIGPRLASKLVPRAPFENVLTGALSRDDSGWTLTVAGGLRLSVPAPAVPSTTASYAVPAEDVLLSLHPLTGISARNVLPATVEGLDAEDGDTVVRLASLGATWFARLTPAAVTDLALHPGRAVFLAIKTHALRPL